jgi:hypothetical protein
VSTAAALLVILCVILLAPSLYTSTSTDAQSGMFEALVCMATLPYALVVLVAAVIMRFVSREARLPK